MAEKKVIEKWDGVERRNKKSQPKPIPTGPDIYLGGDGLSGSYSNFLLGTERIALRGYENNSLVPLDIERNIK